MAKYLVETFYNCTFKVSHYLEDINEKELEKIEKRDDKKNTVSIEKVEEKIKIIIKKNILYENKTTNLFYNYEFQNLKYCTFLH